MEAVRVASEAIQIMCIFAAVVHAGAGEVPFQGECVTGHTDIVSKIRCQAALPQNQSKALTIRVFTRTHLS